MSDRIAFRNIEVGGVDVFFREAGPVDGPTLLLLVVRGRHDPLFTEEGALAFRADVPSAEVHFLDAGHFALDLEADIVADLVSDFVVRRVLPRMRPPDPGRGAAP